MPWLWQASGLNSAYAFGKQDGSGPTVLTLAGLGAAPGQSLIFRDVSGQASTAQGRTADAVGRAAPPAANGVAFPGTYTKAPAGAALVAAFTDATGQLIGVPFAPGDGPVLVPVPAGAVLLQLGLNDDEYADNSGSLTMAVTAAPERHCGAGSSLHGCAVFGASLGATCQNYPNWTSGLWPPPPGASNFHMLVVGGGGGGASAQLATGTGGAGGGGGLIIDAALPIPDAPLTVQIGQKGAGAQRYNQPGDNGAASMFGPASAAAAAAAARRKAAAMAATAAAAAAAAPIKPGLTPGRRHRRQRRRGWRGRAGGGRHRGRRQWLKRRQRHRISNVQL